MQQIALQSTITCPHCGHVKEETMPTDACQWFYECERCKTVLRPEQGDCCVFCSYGTNKCPPIQADSRSCCSQTQCSQPRSDGSVPLNSGSGLA
jgi:hypothetical protein